MAQPPATKDLMEHYHPGCGYEAGEFSYGLPEILNWGGEGRKFRIGKYCSIASGTRVFLGGNHRTDWVTTFPFSVFDPMAEHIDGHPASNGDVEVGHDVWLGQSCTIMSGVTIGHGACIAACAVVTRNVPPYAIVGGNPARLIRSRFSEAQIEALLQICWWDWSAERIREFYPLILSNNIDGFIKEVLGT